jgi:hypothetical protein
MNPNTIHFLEKKIDEIKMNINRNINIFIKNLN